MDFQIYESSANIISKNLWNSSLVDMDGASGGNGNGEYFNWTNELKIDDNSSGENENGTAQGGSGNHISRKRKLSATVVVTVDGIGPLSENSLKERSGNGGGYKQQAKEGRMVESSAGADKQTVVVQGKKDMIQNGTSRMPQWQVDDIADLNADIEGSLNDLGADHSNNSFNMNDAILSISGLAVFKQEAPSPTNNPQDQAVQYGRNGTLGNSQTNDGNNNASNMLNNTLHQLLGQTGYGNVSPDGNILGSTSPIQDNYAITSTNSGFAEDCRFQYVLAAATSIATKTNEDTLTYLNQGQSYEIKLKKLGDLSQYRGKMLQTVIRICFHERRLQYMEKEQMTNWQSARPGDRILEVDVPLSYGLCDVIQPTNALNIVQFNWDPTKEVGVYIKVNCISTEFTPKKHGGEKGVPFRIQVVTYQPAEVLLHAAACQIKVFKLKGADRKHKQDREKILKRPTSEQDKYQPSYECTVLNDIPNEAVVSFTPLGPLSPEIRPSNANNHITLNNQIVPKLDDQQFVSQSTPTAVAVSPIEHSDQIEQSPPLLHVDNLPPNANPQQATKWLITNRFEKYLSTFSSFSGADLLRMSRDDFMQVCGQADGIRLYNALHSKSIAPKLTLYVCRQNANLFNAIYLTGHRHQELVQKLAAVMAVPAQSVRDIYMQGPQSIHVHVDDDVLRHLKDETMFNVEVLHDKNSYVFLLKPDLSGK